MKFFRRNMDKLTPHRTHRPASISTTKLEEASTFRCIITGSHTSLVLSTLNKTDLFSHAKPEAGLLSDIYHYSFHSISDETLRVTVLEHPRTKLNNTEVLRSSPELLIIPIDLSKPTDIEHVQRDLCLDFIASMKDPKTKVVLLGYLPEGAQQDEAYAIQVSQLVKAKEGFKFESIELVDPNQLANIFSEAINQAGHRLQPADASSTSDNIGRSIIA